ncbi:MAG: hypothetical protein NC911_01540 [Candidatus Omnitrophica bacterium]|nr:hypothetical protein [Candidatus Omnitrophota bacterium]
MTILGIDENGLGPLMGPLVVTGVVIQGETKNWLPGAKDSKKFFSSSDPGRLRKLELFCLALFSSIYGYLPESPALFLQGISSEHRCPAEIDLCWSGLNSRFTRTDRKEISLFSERIKTWAEKEKVTLKAIHSQILCSARLNEFFRRKQSKSFVDFCTFASVIRNLATVETEIIAGKIGGLKKYSSWLRYAFPEARIKILQETPELSAYHLILAGKEYRLNFWVKVEEKCLAAALASLVGKFVREIFMESINNYLGNKFPVSGYRDRQTKSFLDKIRPELARRKIPLTCLIRQA